MSYPKKPAITQYPINQLSRERWSPRLFNDQLIAPEKIISLFEAARWAPSSRNEQPWRFIYAAKDDLENFAHLASFLNEGNAWAKKAALLMVVFAKKNFIYNQKSNYNFMYDTGAAALNLVLEAVNQGLVAHQMVGFDKERALAELGLAAEEYQAASMIAVGYPASLEDLNKTDEEFRKRELAERERLDLNDIIFKGHYENRH